MATNTTNLGLIKPAGTDKVRIAQINQNMDILDEKIGPVGNTSVQNQIIANDSGMAIVSTGNTHSAIASGQYVYIRSHGTLAEGLYKANSAISANATLSTSNVTHISSGGMNDLKEQIDSLNSNIANLPDVEIGSWTPDLPRDTISNVYATYVRIGRLLFITAQFTNVHGSGVSYINYNSFPVPTGYRQAYGFHGSWVSDTSDTIGACGQFSENKNFRFASNGAAIALPSEPISFNAVCSLQPL